MNFIKRILLTKNLSDRKPLTYYGWQDAQIVLVIINVELKDIDITVEDAGK